MTAALLYVRVSSQEQAKGWSPETQFEACRAYADQNGMTIVGEYEDVESGTIAERDGFQRMMADIRAGKAMSVIVYQTDRLHRDLAHAMLTRKELQRLGVDLYTVKRGKSGVTPEEQFADNIDDLLAELERARIIERTNRGKHAKMKAGQVLGAGSAPYGYTYVGQNGDRHLVIDEATAPVVRLIFQWYAFGDEHSGPLSVNAIAARLTDMGMPSPADVAGREKWGKTRPVNTWTRNHVYPLLNQTAYSGTYILYRKKRTSKTTYSKHKPSEQFQVSVPALLDKETWDAAQARLAAGQSLSRGHQVHDYLDGRHIRCACGYKAHGRASSKNGRHRETRLWYICNGRVKRLTAGECGVTLPWFRAEEVDRIVWGYLAAILRDDAVLEARITRKRKADKKPVQSTSRDTLLNRRTKAERANQRILDLYEAEEIDRQEWRRRKAANDTQIAEINAQLAALDMPPPNEPPPMPEKTADAVRALAADVRPRLDTLPFEGQRKLIEALAVQVTLQHREGQKQVKVESIFGVDVLDVP